MLKDLISGKQVYVVTGYTDLRKSIDGLAAIVQGQLEVDVFSKGVFLFCGRRCDRIKGLLYEIVSPKLQSRHDSSKYYFSLVIFQHNAMKSSS